MNSDTPWNVRMKVLWPMWWPWVACPAFFQVTFYDFLVCGLEHFSEGFFNHQPAFNPLDFVDTEVRSPGSSMLDLKIERFYPSFWGIKNLRFCWFHPLVWSVVPSKGLTPACWTPWIDPRHSDTGVCLLLGAKGLLHMTRRIFNR